MPKNTRCHNVDKGCRPVLSRLYSVSYFAVRARASCLDAGISCLTANHTYILHLIAYKRVWDTQIRMLVSNLLVYSNHVFLMISECRCVPCRKIVVAPSKWERKSSTVAHCCWLLVIIRWRTCICKPKGVMTIWRHYFIHAYLVVFMRLTRRIFDFCNRLQGIIFVT